MAWDRRHDAQFAAEELRQFILDHAASLSEFALQVREEYARIHGDAALTDGTEIQVPTLAQGVALADFLRGRINRAGAWAKVARGDIGLPANYIHVHFDDGYEGGIAPDGRVST